MSDLPNFRDIPEPGGGFGVACASAERLVTLETTPSQAGIRSNRPSPTDTATTALKTVSGEPCCMFEEIMEKFEGSPSQQSVIRLLLERGFSVNDEGRIVSGGIEIPNTGIAREIDVDRRVVDSTTDAILEDDQLRRIFQNISQVPSLMDLAPVLDLTVVAVEVTHADEAGIVATVTGKIAERDISIRQTISEDPEFTDEPKLHVVTDHELPGDLINELRALEFVRKLEFQ